MNCPVCEVPLRVSDRQGVEIDHCPECRGVWLDRGELDKIIERSGSVQAADRDDDRDDDDRRRSDDPNRRRASRRGFLGELFDFE